MVCCPSCVSCKGHDGLEPQLLVIRDLDNQRNDLTEDYAFFRRHHPAHCSHAEERSFELLPVWYRSARCLGTVGRNPPLDQIERFTEAFCHSDNVAAVFQHVSHLVSELAKLFLLLSIAIKKVCIVSIRVRILQMLDHDIYKLAEDAGIMDSCLFVFLQRDDLLKLEPEKEGQCDGIAVLVPAATF